MTGVSSSAGSVGQSGATPNLISGPQSAAFKTGSIPVLKMDIQPNTEIFNFGNVELYKTGNSYLIKETSPSVMVDGKSGYRAIMGNSNVAGDFQPVIAVKSFSFKSAATKVGGAAFEIIGTGMLINAGISAATSETVAETTRNVGLTETAEGKIGAIGDGFYKSMENNYDALNKAGARVVNSRNPWEGICNSFGFVQEMANQGATEWLTLIAGAGAAVGSSAIDGFMSSSIVQEIILEEQKIADQIKNGGAMPMPNPPPDYNPSLSTSQNKEK